MAEGLTLLGPLDGFRQQELRPTHATGAQLQPPHVEDVEGDLVTLPDFTQDVFDRNMRVLEA